MIRHLFNDPPAFVLLLTLLYLIAMMVAVNLTYKPEVKHYQLVNFAIQEI